MAKLRARRSVGRPSADLSRDLPAEILETSVRLFAERGIDRVRLTDIAQAAGVATSLVHHHFGTRDLLLQDCSDYVLRELSGFMTDIGSGLPDDPNPRDLEVLQSLTGELRQRVYLLRYLGILLMKGDAGATEMFKQYFATMHDLTLRFSQKGLIRADIDPIWVTFLFAYLQMGTVFMHEQVKAILETDPYKREISDERTTAMIKIATSGIFAKT